MLDYFYCVKENCLYIFRGFAHFPEHLLRSETYDNEKQMETRPFHVTPHPPGCFIKVFTAS